MKKFILSSFCLLFLGLSCLAADNPKKTKPEAPKKSEEKAAYILRFTWTAQPKGQTELYITSGGEHIAVDPGVMDFTQPIKYTGGSVLTLSRKTEGTGGDGQPAAAYERILDVNLSSVNGKEIGVILIPNRVNGAIASRLLNFNAKDFPYGTISLINFSKIKAAVGINETKLVAAPEQKVQSSIFNSETEIELSVSGTGKEGERISICNAQVIIDNSLRLIYFLSEKTIEGETSYSVKSIHDSNPNPSGATASVEEKPEASGKKSNKK